MSPAWIRVRRNQDGSKSFQVIYRAGGAREYAQRIAGSFRGWPGGKDDQGRPKTPVKRAEQEARLRRDLIGGWLAQGLDPAVELARLRGPQVAPRTMLERFDDFIATRVDVGAKALASYRNARDRLGELENLLPEHITVAALQTWIAANSHLAPATVEHYLSSIRQVLDYADVTPNPARSPKLKLPAKPRSEPVPPTRPEWDKIKAQITQPVQLLLLRLLEATGLRIGEALKLVWGDVDFASGQLRISIARTKGKTAGQRWLPVPQPLLDEIAELLPFEDRLRDRRVFTGIADWVPRKRLTDACKLAGVVHYHPHDLRHRRISLWFAHGIDPITIKTWAGHSHASMSSDRYGHVLVSGDDEWRTFWLETYRRTRLPEPVETSGEGGVVVAREDEEA